LPHATPRLHVTGVLESAIYVDDVERAVSFYQSLFGFQVLDRDERLTALAVREGQVLLICKRGASAHRTPGAHDAAGPQHLAFAIPAADLDEWEARLQAQHVVVEERRAWPRGGRSVYFRDPDGHLLELATPGVWGNY
jgi:catechol 2,3-dioxygenase-like lactoylglutathione lyase family enzyme